MSCVLVDSSRFRIHSLDNRCRPISDPAKGMSMAGPACLETGVGPSICLPLANAVPDRRGRLRDLAVNNQMLYNRTVPRLGAQCMPLQLALRLELHPTCHPPKRRMLHLCGKHRIDLRLLLANCSCPSRRCLFVRFCSI